jgi:hypothetical protein
MKPAQEVSRARMDCLSFRNKSKTRVSTLRLRDWGEFAFVTTIINHELKTFTI